MTDQIDTARQEGIALGLAMAAQKARTMLDGSGDHQTVVTMRLVFAELANTILALAPIPPHVAAARVLQRYVDAMSPPQQGRVSVTMFEADDMESGYLDTFRAALEQIAKEGE